MLDREREVPLGLEQRLANNALQLTAPLGAARRSMEAAPRARLRSHRRRS